MNIILNIIIITDTSDSNIDINTGTVAGKRNIGFTLDSSGNLLRKDGSGCQVGLVKLALPSLRRWHFGQEVRTHKDGSGCQVGLVPLGNLLARTAVRASHLLTKNSTLLFSSVLLSSLELSDTQSLCALNTSPSRNRCKRYPLGSHRCLRGIGPSK